MSHELRILVLEDRAADAEIQLRELKGGGIAFCARRVETEEQFLAELEAWCPDVILADYSLPAFDGVSALALAKERSPEIPFIFVTGTMGEEIAIDTLKQGATDYVLKQRLGRLVPAVTRALKEAEDLKRRKEAEEALRKETLQRLRAMEELHEKNEILIQQSRQAAMGEMIGHIAHQWRQPLNALALNIQEIDLLYDCEQLDRRSLSKSTGTSMELIRHMSQTIDDFRNFFRPEKRMVEFRSSEAVANALKLTRGSFKDEGIEVEVVQHHDAVINGYKNEFAQVLLNLLNNARDVLVERRVAAPRVTVTTSGSGGRAVVTIADNAGGIDEAIMGKVFEPYFTTKGPQQGTGVGLFMSRMIIEKNMGGRLTVRNGAAGAEFTVEL